MWLVTLEDSDGMWSDDPIGGFSKQEAIDLALKQWPKPDHGEVRVLYRCTVECELTNTDQPMTGQLAGA